MLKQYAYCFFLKIGWKQKFACFQWLRLTDETKFRRFFNESGNEEEHESSAKAYILYSNVLTRYTS